MKSASLGLIGGLAISSLAAVGCGTSAEEHFARADGYAKAGRHHEAVVEFHRAVQENDEYGEAYYRLAQSSERIGDYVHASRYYILAGQRLLDRVDVQVQSATMLLLGRRFDEALACAERALHREPQNVRARILHAHALSGLKRTGEALSSIQAAVALDPTRGETYADFGIFQFVTGSFEQGEENLRKAAEARPPSTAAQLTLAAWYWAQGRLEDAERYLNRAVETAPADVRASRALATFYLANNRSTEAEQRLRLIAERSDAAVLRIALADYYIVMDRKDDAVRLLEQLAAERDGYADARSRLAALRYADGRTAAAHQLIEETLQREPRSARALLTKAHFLLAERRIEEGATTLRAAVDADPLSVPARFALAIFYAANQDVPLATQELMQVLELDPQSVAARMELARLNLAIGNAELAAQYAEAASNARPGIDASLLHARALVAKGEISRAETVLRPHLDGTTRADVLSLAGAMLIGVGESDRGRALIERAARLNPNDIQVVESLVAVDLAARNVARARTVAEQQLARQPQSARLMVLTARTYGAAGEADRMVGMLRRAIQTDPASTAAYALLGQVYATQGRLPEALAEYQRVVERDRRTVPGNTMVGFLLERLGRGAEAEKRYERVLELDPRAPVAANNLAWLLTERGGNLDEALQLAQTAKQVMPESPEINDTLAWVYYRKELPDLSIPPLRLAIEREPDNPIFHYHAGLVYVKTGEIAAARNSLETALKLNPSFSGAADAREKLARLQ